MVLASVLGSEGGEKPTTGGPLIPFHRYAIVISVYIYPLVFFPLVHNALFLLSPNSCKLYRFFKIFLCNFLALNLSSKSTIRKSEPNAVANHCSIFHFQPQWLLYMSRFLWNSSFPKPIIGI